MNIVRAQGVNVFDDAGNEYIDACASLWYCNIGHGRKKVADAIHSQLLELDAFHAFDRYTNPRADELCERLAALSPIPEARVFLTSGGSDSVETALKLAHISAFLKDEPDRKIIVAREPSFHGVHYGAMSVTGITGNRSGFGEMPNVLRVPADDVDELRRVFREHGHEIVAFIAEPVTGAGGVLPPVAGYFEEVRRLCSENGVMLIADEVICGFGRLGYWWGSQRYNIQPDLITFAKGVTSGYQPLGGVLVGKSITSVLEGAPDFVLKHGFTYSGHPTACAAALAVLDITEDEKLIDRANEIGAWLEAGFSDLQGSSKVAGFRGAGAARAAVLNEGILANSVRDAMLERGVIARPIGDSLIAFSPPLIMTEAEVSRCLDVLADSIAAVASSTPIASSAMLV